MADGLQIKSMDDVFNNFVEWVLAKTDKISDFNVGSAIRTLSEAIAIQFEEFYFDMKQNILYAIENSIYYAFDFDLKVANPATGYVTVKFLSALPSPLTFPKGTIFCTSAQYGYIYYESTMEVTAPYEAYSIMIPVQCKTNGTLGNVPAGAITTIITTNPIIESVTNPVTFTDGIDDETQAERKKRFQTYIKTLARGTADAITYGALEVEGVAGAIVDDRYIGYVKLYVHDSDGELPAELKAAVLSNVNDYRAAGIEVEVLNVIKKLVDLTLTIVISNDYSEETYYAMLQTLITTTLNDYSVSESFYMADLIHAIKNVYDDIVINVVIKEGKDVTVEPNELIRCGELTLTVVNIRNWKEE